MIDAYRLLAKIHTGRGRRGSAAEALRQLIQVMGEDRWDHSAAAKASLEALMFLHFVQRGNVDQAPLA